MGKNKQNNMGGRSIRNGIRTNIGHDKVNREEDIVYDETRGRVSK